MPLLNSAVRVSRAEEQMLVSWLAPRRGTQSAEPRALPTTRECRRPAGEPVPGQPTATERLVSGTNRRWRLHTDSDEFLLESC